ncbi:hypothetical protein [Desulfoscipio gibsoniae]|uniref:Uncharacterized protein n=1 Tax=Desulfoscipio gibsoniae DSM 7213 TaxID=767817 RepID=R4KP88_9FIRM|nr:hypothetical protein [Desulfoscipio gibsoniae]AGL01451.1 hypothetical protein Desgi_2009 [Desulfoscipio gibsoniae DSM 7213]
MRHKEINPARALDDLESILGKDWLEENLKSMKDGQNGKGGFGRFIDFTELGIAHVVKIWYKAREETIDREIVGGGMPGPYTLAVAAMAGDLEPLYLNAGLSNKIDELKETKLSLRVMHELGIASGYARKGYRIDFIKRQVVGSIQGCDVLPGLGVFMVESGVSKAAIICADAHPQNDLGDIFYCARHFPGASQNAGDGGDAALLQRVLCLYVADGLTDGASRLDEWAVHPELMRLSKDDNLPVLLYTDGIKNMHNRSVYVRWGRLVEGNQAALFKDIYIPDEIITAAEL